ELGHGAGHHHAQSVVWELRMNACGNQCVVPPRLDPRGNDPFHGVVVGGLMRQQVGSAGGSVSWDEHIGVQRLQCPESLPHAAHGCIFVVVVVSLEHQVTADRHPLVRQK